MSPQKEALSHNQCLEELATATLILADGIDTIRDHFKLYIEMNPALPNHSKDFLHLLSKTIPEVKPRYKLGETVLYSGDSSAFEFTIEEIHIMQSGVFYNMYRYPQENISRIASVE